MIVKFSSTIPLNPINMRKQPQNPPQTSHDDCIPFMWSRNPNILPLSHLTPGAFQSRDLYLWIQTVLPPSSSTGSINQLIITVAMSPPTQCCHPPRDPFSIYCLHIFHRVKERRGQESEGEQKRRGRMFLFFLHGWLINSIWTFFGFSGQKFQTRVGMCKCIYSVVTSLPYICSALWQG